MILKNGIVLKKKIQEYLRGCTNFGAKKFERKHNIMTTLKIIPEEKPDINKVTVCSLLDKPALSRNVFTQEECNRIIEMGKTWEQLGAEIQTKSSEEESEKNNNYRNCKMYAPPVDKTKSWLWIGEKISAAIYNFNAKDGWKFNLAGMAERPMMMEYSEGQGKYDYHIDLGPSRLASTRKLGFTLFLNDEYEGGEFQIKTGRENYIPPQQETGNLLFFPSYLVHRVTLVTKGTRSVIVGWVHGNSFM
jgi:predicted 2-oxoglutarate/Fe(II)-dependent dioxygenase YbiX